MRGYMTVKETKNPFFADLATLALYDIVIFAGEQLQDKERSCEMLCATNVALQLAS